MIIVRKAIFLPAGVSDPLLAALYEIECACFEELLRWPFDAFGPVLRRSDVWVSEQTTHCPASCPDCDILVPVPADPNHKCSKIVVGFLVADKEDGQGHISTIDVLPEHRGKGIATSLIHAAEEDYTKRGFKEMRLEVEVNNRAQTLYFKIGYRVTGVTKKYYDDGSACIRMTKKLETEEALISRMNTPAALEGMSTAFAATPVELGLAAVENAKLP